jgi:hypothetical protein
VSVWRVKVNFLSDTVLQLLQRPIWIRNVETALERVLSLPHNVSSIMNSIREQFPELSTLLEAQSHESLIECWQKPFVLSSLNYGKHLKLQTS